MDIRHFIFLLCTSLSLIGEQAQDRVLQQNENLRANQADLTSIREELLTKTSTPSKKSALEILNVSYDPTREFYDEYNTLFRAWWKKNTGQNLFVVQSHGGSSKQARAVISGLEADIVSLALAFDIDAIQKLSGLLDKNWQKKLPNNSAPYFSTIVFLVRKGNPKQIKDWNDLTRDDVKIITSNPKTSGGAKWAYLAAWAWALETSHHDYQKAKTYLKKIYDNAPVMDTGARGATTTFIQRKMGDLLLTWENEAYLTMEKIGAHAYEIVYPSMSIRTEPPVAWLDEIIQEKSTEDVAKFYLKYLYSIPAQELIAKHYFRPYDLEILNKYGHQFPQLRLITIDGLGGWENIHNMHFRDGGLFDDIYFKERKKR